MTRPVELPPEPEWHPETRLPLRGVGLRNAAKERCRQGHYYHEGNIYLWRDRAGRVHRKCRTCVLWARRAAYRTARLSGSPAGNPTGRPPSLTCSRGHRWDENESYRRPRDGSRYCLVCRRDRDRAERAGKRAAKQRERERVRLSEEWARVKAERDAAEREFQARRRQQVGMVLGTRKSDREVLRRKLGPLPPASDLW